MKNPKFAPRPIPERQIEPFTDVEQVWFWFIHNQEMRHDGARPERLLDIARPCDPDDIYVIVMTLRRIGKIAHHHLQVLFEFGRSGRPPDSRAREEEIAARLWDEALDRMITPLKAKGILE
ncbi:hypothetical protein [Magnetospira sp. QH-2]|uniref:hypothetical protein n=1 Tax=Magnetospira sp. (strain QH-2) TaxID=1288970 RepID=UPI0003E80C3D|nr:hypothetical protein [Magnetospira sp. QH-2]CCQ72349.1 conserved protein of unknown function [Magnetospira sp. QH-2]